MKNANPSIMAAITNEAIAAHNILNEAQSIATKTKDPTRIKRVPGFISAPEIGWIVKQLLTDYHSILPIRQGFTISLDFDIINELIKTLCLQLKNYVKQE